MQQQTFFQQTKTLSYFEKQIFIFSHFRFYFITSLGEFPQPFLPNLAHVATKKKMKWHDTQKSIGRSEGGREILVIQLSIEEEGCSTKSHRNFFYEIFFYFFLSNNVGSTINKNDKNTNILFI